MKNYKLLIIAIIAIIVVFFIGKSCSTTNYVEKNNIRIDTTNVVTIEDSTRIANKAKFEVQDKLKDYLITNNGEWLSTDTVLVAEDSSGWIAVKNVSTLDTTFNKDSSDSTSGITSLKMLQSMEPRLLSFSFKSIAEREGFFKYNALVNISYKDSTWTAKVDEDLEMKKEKETVYITKEISIPTYDPNLKSFTDRFGIGPVAAIGFNLDGKFDAFIGIGIHYSF